METVAFYSYKGGVGRSLLLANAARFLATLGKGVVALDFDFEAPGLHYKLVGNQDWDLNSDLKPEKGGAVPYLNATAEGSSAPPPLEDHMISVPVPPGGAGWLRLMPAGPAPDQKYWTAFKQLGERLRLGDPSGRGFMALLDLQARIADELKPDYLLIDARTGVTELGGLATTILADVVVCLFAANQESLDGTLTVVDALRAAPRLANQKPIRVAPVMARTTAKPSDERFTNGVKRLAQLEQGSVEGQTSRSLFELPHDNAFGGSERVVGGERRASAFSPLYKAYLELFQALFPSGAADAREALKRLEAVARIKEELTSHREHYESDDRLSPWNASAIQEGFEIGPKKGGRYADLLCSDEAGKPLMAVDYVGDGDADDALEFWSKSTKVRCVVLLVKSQYSIERKIFAREEERGDLSPTERWDLPRPKEFELLRNVGDRSVEAMLEAVGHGHVEAVTWLVSEWRDATLGGDEMHPIMRRRAHWHPERAQRVLDGLAGTEDLRCAEEILRRARPGGFDLRRRDRHFREDWRLGEAVEEKVAEELFAPLFWRLPIEAVLESMKERRYPGDWGSLAGYRLLAQDLMGLRYDPDRTALEDARALSIRLPSRRERSDDAEDDHVPRLAYRSRREHSERVQLSEDAPAALIWGEALHEEPFERVTLEEAKEKVGEKVKKMLASVVGLRKRLKEIAARRELAIQGLLGNYEVSGRIELYPQVITAAAEVLGIVPRYLKSVVFIHLSAWAMAYEAYDLDDQRGYGFAPAPPTNLFIHESPTHVAVVQAFTDRLIRRLRDPNLQAAFEKLSEHQPEHYRQWKPLGKFPLERLRMLLLKARGSGPALGLPASDDGQ